MYIRLIRNEPQGNAITGRMVVDGQWCCDTLEHWEYAIPKGFYRVRLTLSPRFNELLPLLDHVIGYARDPHNGIFPMFEGITAPLSIHHHASSDSVALWLISNQSYIHNFLWELFTLCIGICNQFLSASR